MGRKGNKIITDPIWRFFMVICHLLTGYKYKLRVKLRKENSKKSFEKVGAVDIDTAVIINFIESQ